MTRARRGAPAAADTESIEAHSLSPGPPALVGVQSQCPARIEPAPPGGGPHGEHGATQGPHSTPAQNTEAEYRTSLLDLPRRTRAPWPRIRLFGHWAVD